MTTKFLRRREVEEVTGLSRSTIYALMSRGEFPKPVKVSTRAVRWRSDAIERWQESRVGGDLPPNPPRRRNPDGDARRTGKRHAGIRNQGGVGRRGAGTPPVVPPPSSSMAVARAFAAARFSTPVTWTLRTGAASTGGMGSIGPRLTPAMSEGSPIGGWNMRISIIPTKTRRNPSTRRVGRSTT